MQSNEVSEIGRILWLLAIAVIAGLLAGHLQFALLVTVSGLLVWYFINLARLNRWLIWGKTYSLPGSWGLWDEVFFGIHRLQKGSRKRKKRLVNLLSRFRESTNAMPDGAVVLSPRGEIEWWNDAAGHLLDLHYPKDVGQRITNLLRHPDFIAYVRQAVYTDTVEMVSPLDETRYLSMYIVAYGRNQQLLMVHDITLVRRLEQMRGDFVANVSHELRTPLTVINGYLETMNDSDDDYTCQWRRSLQLMQQQALRMQNIVEDLLLLSRLEYDKERHKDEPVAVPEMLASLREDAVSLSGDKQHHIDIECEPSVYLHGNSKELESAFTNLVANAVRYTPAGGSIHLRWYKDEKGAHYEVQDTGVGIPTQDIPRLTERFYRVDVARSREQGGTGLGLAIVKHVLKRHDAALRIESRFGKGSVFVCDFPPSRVMHRDDVHTSADQG